MNESLFVLFRIIAVAFVILGVVAVGAAIIMRNFKLFGYGLMALMFALSDRKSVV